ncbi:MULTISPECIES: pyrimidine-nucleoside phosphorylase [unclassified Candidatus Frackibacter]|uniref:pyrimidine-nucleoside phosphorylase n=1 Tax=unclassified Candidatus Frackibacter TaxID=2648818 RepID=UPI000884E0A9|nr:MULTISPECIES: pyrimidine-nucleoside phosphorylase [unclassified Candidatus Frackibacter]SDC02013.1 pyrimidine-nucleoside phosphorylase [Candidatus Frackibacter sp. WG11]SEM33235.1 pyrimidine-nucleoside phosphorylase [Candidatus Frackibacter sp. WG12]SFL38236.1 pyrimidine-nucleoside phosphorylase [Candidatus Frackibacter sp. WG13]
MRAYDIILKKREGNELSKEEIEYLIEAYTAGELPDYQLSAWAMAVFFKGMNERETADLTMTMANSGDTIDLSPIQGVKVDKHSTGGVGDTTTLVLAPLVAAAGAPVAKMSGRGLGHTGGTIDKLESIPDFNTSLSREQFINNVNDIKVAVAGQTGNLAPADKKLYALRDVTATVDSIPLIASSIMSKKIAAGADGIVLDVKVGDGAFMKDYEEAKRLAKTMVDIGKNVQRETIAVISDMNQPLGLAVGNALEVKEAIETLRGEGPVDLTALCLTLGSQMLRLSGVVKSVEAGREELEKVLTSGAGLKKLKEMITAQGGNPEVVDNYNLLPTAKQKIELKAEADGYIEEIAAEDVGIAAMLLGAGRKSKEDNIDMAVGVELAVKVGEEVSKGDKLALLHVNEQSDLTAAREKLQKAYTITTEPVEEKALIYEIVK